MNCIELRITLYEFNSTSIKILMIHEFKTPQYRLKCNLSTPYTKTPSEVTSLICRLTKIGFWDDGHSRSVLQLCMCVRLSVTCLDCGRTI